MFTIIKGDEKKVKAEMKAMSKNVTKLKAAIVKKSGGRADRMNNEDALKVIDCEKASLFLTVTTIIPAYWDDFLLNYKLANDAMKKLKGYRVTLEIASEKNQPRKLIIRYTNGRNKGFIELNELPKDVFASFEHRLVVTPIGETTRKAM